MDNIYNRVDSLCRSHGIDITTMCKEAKISRAVLSEYKMGRTKNLSTSTLEKIADYFDISIDYLLTGEEKENSPHYSSDDEFWELRQEMAERSEMRTLFDLSRNATKEDIEFVNEMLKRMKGDVN